jgi:hypothetical protein
MSEPRRRRTLKIVALLAGAAALVFGIFRGRPRRAGEKRSIDVGAVSEGWLAEQRGVGTDRSMP